MVSRPEQVTVRLYRESDREAVLRIAADTAEPVENRCYGLRVR